MVALAAAPVSGARPAEHITGPIDLTFTDVDLCGILVTIDVTGRQNTILYDDGSAKDTSSVTFKYTNADGDWILNRSAGPIATSAILDGTILTLTTQYHGIQERLITSDGITRAFDRGSISFTDVIDLHDLDNPDGDELLYSAVVVGGPHTEFDSDFELFCEIVTDVLG
jgi:hypothetical protein